ncbi:MAG: hypothetical protein GX037_03760, partial [Trueperella sp.]|nr:hypothetical protein [Trueperella sp.]
MTQPHYDDTSDQIAVRKEKRQRMLDEGRHPYPPELVVENSLAEIRAGYVVADGADAGASAGAGATGDAATDSADDPARAGTTDGSGVPAPGAEDVTVLQPGDELTDVTVKVAGRVMLFRPSGKIAFVQLQSGAGDRLQVIFS